jgi:hypothetical protein
VDEMDDGNSVDNASRCVMPVCAASHVTESSSSWTRATIPAGKLRKIFAFARDRWAAVQMSLKDVSGPFSAWPMEQTLRDGQYRWRYQAPARAALSRP